MKTATQQ